MSRLSAQVEENQSQDEIAVTDERRDAANAEVDAKKAKPMSPDREVPEKAKRR